METVHGSMQKKIIYNIIVLEALTCKIKSCPTIRIKILFLHIMNTFSPNFQSIELIFNAADIEQYLGWYFIHIVNIHLHCKI